MRVFVISAYPTVRAGLRALAQIRSSWSVVGEATPAALGSGAGESAGRAPVAGDVDVVLADLDTPLDADVLSAIATATQPRLGVVVIGVAGDTVGADETQAAARAAAALGPLGLGMLPRDASSEEILAAVEAVASGLVVMDRRTAGSLLTAPGQSPASRAADAARASGPDLVEAPGDSLTPRELEVLQLLAQGLANKTIALRLHVSEHTAKFHVASIMTKLGAASRTEAVTLAARRGLLIL
jgi:two-component system, NarL family, response regulator YdfI